MAPGTHTLYQMRWLELQIGKGVKLRMSLGLGVRPEGVIAEMHVRLC